VRATVALLFVVLVPRAAWACATCVSSAYGDRTFNWAFLGLLLMPFVVGLGIAAVFAARYFATHREAYPGPSGGALPAAQLEHEVVGAAEHRGSI
jgi:hypothetical protein